MACRRAAGRATTKCLACGATFTRKRSELGAYCSRACTPGRPTDPANHLTRDCPGCGATFTTPKYRPLRHCSMACRTAAASIEKDCPECGKRFTYQRSWPHVYCSQRCYGRSRHKGGKVYYGANWVVQRSLAIVRDDGKCQDCGSGEHLHVHHLRALRDFAGDWRTANELDNLITLCMWCHLAVHGGNFAGQPA